MQKNAPSESAFLNMRTLLGCALVGVASLLAYVSVAAPAAPDSRGSTATAATAVAENWSSKVDERVLTAAATGETRFLIYMKEQADLSGSSSLKTKDEKGHHTYQRLTATAAATQSGVKQTLTQLGGEYQAFWVSNTISARGNLAIIQAVASLPEVAAIYPIGKGKLQVPAEEAAGSGDAEANSTDTANAAPVSGQGVTQVGAADVWALGIRGQGVTVAGSDTGVRFTHEAVRNQYRGWGGSPEASVHDYNWHDAIHLPNWPPDPLNRCNPGGAGGTSQPNPVPCDDDDILGGGHGTHTVGTMVGDNGAGEQIGMAPGAKWMACRNMSRGVGDIPTYLECMEFFLAPTKVDGSAPDPTKAPHVINNSWGCIEGCPPEPNPIRDALRASRAAGIVYVVSAGNDGPACGTIQNPPARYPEAFTVGSTMHPTDAMSEFSSRGPSAADPNNLSSPLYRKPNITAPGEDIRSASAYIGPTSARQPSDSGYKNLSGTSMAGPHVAGLVALVISANLELAGNVDRIEEIIEQSAVKKTSTEMCGLDDGDDVPNNTYGWGRIDALAAVKMAQADIPQAAQLLNISTRARVQTGDNVLIGGFIVTGAEPKQVLLRAMGPSMNANGVPVQGRMTDPTLELYDATGALVTTNDNWTESPERAQIEATGIPPNDDRESAIVRTLAPGSYTAVLSGKNESTGIALVEIYDRSAGANSVLANISSRGFVEAADNVMIGGFIAGNNTGNTKILVRAIGPSLQGQVPNALADTTLEVYDANGVPIGSNDNWQESPDRAEIEASGIPPTHEREAAVVRTVAPAGYTAILRGKNDTSGVGVVEIYDIP